jgi:CO/xanthine dehydrogenase Mo-binding subunit
VRAAFSAPITMLDAQMRGAPFQTFDYLTQVAEVEVDTETGAVYVRRVTTVEDVGRAINPTIVEGQIDGCVAQGLGFALYEDVRLEGGRVMNPFLFSYRVPRMEDMPRSDKVLLELGDPMGPHGAKAVGEAAIVPIAAAIANAIYDATGFRPTSLPVTPERVQAGAKQATSPLAVGD